MLHISSQNLIWMILFKIECENQRKSGLIKGFLPTLFVLAATVILLKLSGLMYQRRHPQKNPSNYSVTSQ